MRKTVLQISPMNNTVIKEWESIAKAAEELNNSVSTPIYNIVGNPNRVSLDSRWCYASEFKPEDFKDKAKSFNPYLKCDYEVTDIEGNVTIIHGASELLKFTNSTRTMRDSIRRNGGHYKNSKWTVKAIL